ncbi:MAG: biotin--[acetyl-CoA-carboxylase] ligase, partial [Actinomycetota bacterium]
MDEPEVLATQPGDLSQATVEESLGGAFGSPLRFCEEIGSTNTEALAWAKQGAPEGALVVTNHQTQGRGRWGRSWSSAPGKLLQFSLVLRPAMEPGHLGLVTTALGVACAQAIEALCGLDP